MSRSACEVCGETYDYCGQCGTCHKCMGEDIDRLKAELEQTRVQLAGCGVAAMCNTRESMTKQMCKPTDYGYSASYQDVLNAVNREILLRETLEDLERQLAEARAELERFKHMVWLISTEMCEWVEKERNEIRQQAAREICSEIMGGSFLHDQAPEKLFAGAIISMINQRYGLEG